MDQAMRAGRVDEKVLLDSEMLSFGGPVPGTEEQFQVQFLINDRRGTVAQEAFPPNSTVNWAFWHDEVHLVIRGEAEVSYTLAPNHRKVVTRRFSEGDTYVIPNGARVQFRVGEEPYVHVCVIMPRFEYSKDERADRYE
jgi:mannose-6-phosphate isomerase-like protein (cupin superfamily)